MGRIVGIVGNALLSAFIVMVLIFIIKKASGKFNIPVVSTIAEGV